MSVEICENTLLPLNDVLLSQLSFLQHLKDITLLINLRIPFHPQDCWFHIIFGERRQYELQPRETIDVDLVDILHENRSDI